MNLRERLTRGRLLALFLGLLALFGFGPMLVVHMLGLVEERAAANAAVSTFRSFAPLFAALVVQGPILGQPVMEPFGLTLRPSRAVLLAWLAPLFALGVGLGFAALVYGISPPLTEEALVEAKRTFLTGDALERFEKALGRGEFSSPLTLITMGMTGGVVLNLIPALAEEVGFRGFLFRELPGGFWTRSMLIGLVWGAFYAPTAYLVELFPGRELEGAALLFVFCLILSPALTYIRVRTGSTIAVAITRAGFAALTKVGVDLSLGLEPILRPPYGVSGLVGAAVLLGLFYAVDKLTPGPRVFAARAKPH